MVENKKNLREIQIHNKQMNLWISSSFSLLLSSLAAGVRGGVFTLMFARLNLRIRNCLFRALMKQEIGFFDANHTGDHLLTHKHTNRCLPGGRGPNVSTASSR